MIRAMDQMVSTTKEISCKKKKMEFVPTAPTDTSTVPYLKNIGTNYTS
jgi:hypothetical protein